MKHAFEIVPLLVAAIIGALVLYTVTAIANAQNANSPNYALLGALTGASVQVGVRLAGVS